METRSDDYVAVVTVLVISLEKHVTLAFWVDGDRRASTVRSVTMVIAIHIMVRNILYYNVFI